MRSPGCYALLSVVPAMLPVPNGIHGRVAVAPVAAIVGVGVGIARSEVLAIGVRIKLRAIAGVRDDGLRQCRACESCRGKCGGANQGEFHSCLLALGKKKMATPAGFAN